MPGITRRQYLASVGSLAVGLPLAAGQAAASHRDEQPEHVTLSYDESTLERYQPKLVMTEDAREKLIGVYGFLATSPDYDHDIAVYGVSYTHQEGISPVPAALYAPLSDSHYGDHEWYYVAISEGGDVEHVIYDQFHWTAGKRPRSLVTMSDTNPVVRVVSPWHFYNHNGVTADQGTLHTVHDLTSAFNDWLANGMEDDLAPGTVVDPARMLPGGRTHWWQDTVGGISFAANYANALSGTGFLGGDETE